MMRRFFLLLLLPAPAAARTVETPAQLLNEERICAEQGVPAPCQLSSHVLGDIVKSIGTTINIKMFGAVGDGNTDDTAAIQSAIDYAYNNHYQGVFCPDGQYKISGNGRAILYLDPPENLRSNWTNPSQAFFSLSFIGASDGLGNANGYGCTLRPTTNSNVALIVGPGQQMHVKGIAVIGPNNAYRGNLNPNGIGIGISGGNGGAHHTIVENTWVQNFSISYAMSAAGNGALSDSNYFKSVSAFNCNIGIQLNATQSFINRADEPIINSCTTAISDLFAHQFSIRGGNLSAGSAVGNLFSISATGNFRSAGDGGILFDTTIASPDVYFPNVYNSFSIVTAHFGVIPLVVNAFNANTNLVTFKIPANYWSAYYNPQVSWGDSTTEITAVSTVYAAERVTVALGEGIALEGTHVENFNVCTTLYNVHSIWGGMAPSSVRNIFFNYDPGLSNIAPSQSPTAAQLAHFYCQENFGFVTNDGGDIAETSLTIDGIQTEKGIGVYMSPLMFDAASLTTINEAIEGSRMNLGPINLRVWDSQWQAYTPESQYLQSPDGIVNGFGLWDRNYTLPHSIADSTSTTLSNFTRGYLKAPHRGVHPALHTMPSLPPDLYARVSGTVWPMPTYAPIDCQTLYQSVNWNSGALAHIFARSAHCPGYSWGQTIDDAAIKSTFIEGFLGSISGTTLTRSTFGTPGGSGVIQPNDQINGVGVTANTVIVSGTDPTFTVNNSQSISTEPMIQTRPNYDALAVGSISTTTLTVSAMTSGTLKLHDEISGPGIAAGTYITAIGTCGSGPGSCTVNNSQTVSSGNINAFHTQVTWNYLGGSNVLYMDAKSIKWMFPGLGFTLPGSPNPNDNYIVTGVFPDLGYVTVIDVSSRKIGNPNQTGDSLQPNDSSVHSCSNQCSIGQAAYSWTQYPP